MCDLQYDHEYWTIRSAYHQPFHQTLRLTRPSAYPFAHLSARPFFHPPTIAPAVTSALLQQAFRKPPCRPSPSPLPPGSDIRVCAQHLEHASQLAATNTHHPTGAIPTYPGKRSDKLRIRLTFSSDSRVLSRSLG